MPKFSTLLGRRHAKGAITTRPAANQALPAAPASPFLGSLVPPRAEPTKHPSLQSPKLCHDATVGETNNNGDYRPSRNPARATYYLQIRLAKVSPHLPPHRHPLCTAAAYIVPYVVSTHIQKRSWPIPSESCRFLWFQLWAAFYLQKVSPAWNVTRSS